MNIAGFLTNKRVKKLVEEQTVAALEFEDGMVLKLFNQYKLRGYTDEQYRGLLIHYAIVEDDVLVLELPDAEVVIERDSAALVDASGKIIASF